MEGEHKVEKKTKANQKISLHHIVSHTAYEIKIKMTMLGYSSLKLEKADKDCP